jgi:hypothetical protein
MASSRPIRHAGCTTTGRVPRRVRTQQATTSAPIRTKLVAPRRSAGQGPSPASGRCVTPTVGRLRTAPSCVASPALRGWSDPVASTSRASGRTVRPRSAASRRVPMRKASRPGTYGAEASPFRTHWASCSRSRNTTAAAQARSPARPGPVSPRGKHTQQPPTSSGPGGRVHGSGELPASSRCKAARASASRGHTPPCCPPHCRGTRDHAPRDSAASPARRFDWICRVAGVGWHAAEENSGAGGLASRVRSRS